MNFINRKSEIEELKNIAKPPPKKLFTTLIYGPRRVGKTGLENKNTLSDHETGTMQAQYVFLRYS